MKERKKLIEGLEYCIEAKDKNCPMACPFFKDCFSVFTSTEPFYPIMRAALEFLKEQEAIIRCKDCKHFLADKTCGNPRLCDQEDISTSGPDWYCADGEKAVKQDADD